MFKFVGLVKVSVEVIDKIFEEICRMLYEELDYVYEGENLNFFVEYYKDYFYVIILELIEFFFVEIVLMFIYVFGDLL